MNDRIPIEQGLGAPSADEVDDAVSLWHAGEGGGSALHEYLGWTFEEYVAWVQNEQAIPQRPLASAQ